MRLPEADKETVYVVTVMDYGRSYAAFQAKTLKLNVTTSIAEGRSGTFEGTL